MMDEVDQELINQVKRGEEGAFRILYEATKQPIFKMVMLLAERKDEAGDIMAEIYMALLQSLPRYDGVKPFPPWLYGLVTRQVSAWNRKRWRLWRIGARAREAYGLQEASEDAERIFFRDEDRRELRELLDRLPYKHREVVLLRYYQELSFEEIAEALDIPVGTAKSRHHDALKKLRKWKVPLNGDLEKEAAIHG